ncbi:MAG: zinc ABC transporter solute-binding protein, partial [Planctomycetia bacterium]|nr:zinc ABC transporter solute-binding protein [Planctomycetia bacterium]
DAFGYFGRAYGVEVHGIQGLSTESEAGLGDMNRLVRMLAEKRIPAVFVESSVSEKNVMALVEGAASLDHHVTVGGELFSDAMGAAGTWEGTYPGMIDHNVNTIGRALGGRVPAGGYRAWRDRREGDPIDDPPGGMVD